MSPSPRRRASRALAPIALAMAALLVGCGAISRTPPVPTPAPFPGIASILGNGGISVRNVVSGDAGCADPDIAKTAIGFDAAGADQTTPVRIHIFIFRNRDTWVRERSAVDHCAAAFITDPATYESQEASPYVVAGQGPWAPTFRQRMQDALTQAAGTGG